jgi:hypothetical protein
MSIDAMKQALEALENAQENFGTWWLEDITALRLAIEQAEKQEPVKAAVEAEREACAKVCEEMFSYGALDIAAAIRSRGKV